MFDFWPFAEWTVLGEYSLTLYSYFISFYCTPFQFQSLAAIALCELGKKPIQNPLAGERVGRNVRHKVFQQFSTREQRIASGSITIHGGASYTGPIAIDGDDVEYLYGIWRNKCAITGAKIGAVLGLARWDASKPASADNLVLVSRPAMKSLDENGKESIDPFVRERIEQRLEACRDTNCDWWGWQATKILKVIFVQMYPLKALDIWWLVSIYFLLIIKVLLGTFDTTSMLVHVCQQKLWEKR